MNTRPGGTSSLPIGSYSVEIRCREVISKTASPWENTVTSESMPLWKAELQTMDKVRCRLRATILAFACFRSPCHAGPMSLHASINYSSEDMGWKRLFGWDGFSFEPVAEAPALEAQAHNPDARGPMLEQLLFLGPLPDPEQQLRNFLDDVREAIDGEWIKMTPVLKRLKELGHDCDSTQRKRFFQTSSTKCWKRAGDLAPRENREWRHAARLARGYAAGSGRGPLQVRKHFLKDIF